MKLEDLKNRCDIGNVLKAMGLNGQGAEVGVAFGENAEMILEHSGLEKLFLIDPWGYVEGQACVGYGDAIKDWDGCYEFCIKKLGRFEGRFDVIRKPSAEGSLQFQDGSLDFVYIDANHMSPNIDEDLSLWFPKVRSGGIIGGHDYYTLDAAYYRCDVEKAVSGFFSRSNLAVHLLPREDSSWYVIKTGG